ncbi:aldehyde dehydrogenase family protein [Streptomyces plumbiresistens]|uniref:Aldehyde dehydrogenase (NADP(+)) n=1 Tax=Streptomyces plumbiresistens TaxID=511811 RepID=A0ABP7SLR6_9ACTN
MTIPSYSPRDGRVLGEVRESNQVELALAVRRAAVAAPSVADTTPAERQRWLAAVADALDAHQEALAQLADDESALGMPRLLGEVSRTAEQLRFYGRVAADGGYLGVTVDEATATAPRLVRINRPLGPVAVFGASNFPFAFGVLGNDTGSAIAAGCPVVAKAHPAHPRTCLRLAEIATEALAAAGAPDGVFSMVVGLQAGVDLVKADDIRAVGFTGSQSGGLALWRIANERQEVIPVFAEMGTVNPVVLTSRGARHLDEMAKGFVGSFTLGAGQFCTKPGLLFAPAGHRAAEAVAAALHQAAPESTMLTQAIAENVTAGVRDLVKAGARVIGKAGGPGRGWSADAVVLTAPIGALTSGSRLLEECFGPIAIVVEYADESELYAALTQLQGSLAGSVFGDGEDDPEAAAVIARLAGQVGRVTLGDWPTGVAWAWAQQHGGPWPATSSPSSTSVGAGALERFVRPVTFQSVPDDVLPVSVRDAVVPENPWRIPRRVDGVLAGP